jgi:hypothetical protein
LTCSGTIAEVRATTAAAIASARTSTARFICVSPHFFSSARAALRMFRNA